MAGDSGSDLLMMFMLDNKPVAAESRTDLKSASKTPSKLMKGFKEGFMFEVDKFSLQIGTKDGDSKDETDKDGNKKKPKVGAMGDRQAWRAGKAQSYPVDVQPVTFSRSIDSASPALLQSCIDCRSYDSVSLVKRKPIGNAAAGEPFLRFDFVGVLVVGVGLSNDDEVQEDCQFIFRSVTINYCPQLPDGSLGAVVPGFWSMVPGERQVTL